MPSPAHLANAMAVRTLQAALSYTSEEDCCSTSSQSSEVADVSHSFCSGTVLIHWGSGKLFYESSNYVPSESGSGKARAQVIDLTHAGLEDLESLVRACDPQVVASSRSFKYELGRSSNLSTTQLGRWDFLPSSNVTTQEMDRSRFAAQFDIYSCGILDRVSRIFLGEQNVGNGQSLVADLCKLTVDTVLNSDHGHGSFRKNSFFSRSKSPSFASSRPTTSTSATPSISVFTDRTDFGTLIVVFPIAHEGGTLSLRHHLKAEGSVRSNLNNGKSGDWTFDSSTVLACGLLDKKNGYSNGNGYGYISTTPSVAFAAFTSDVIPYEFTPIQAGHRVSLTYALRLADTPSFLSTAPSSPFPSSPGAGLPPTPEERFARALTSTLSDHSFLPLGCMLGFGLEYAYPGAGNAAIYPSLSALVPHLSGQDLLIWRVCSSLSSSSASTASATSSTTSLHQTFPKNPRLLSPPELGAVYSQNGQQVLATRPILLGRGPIECTIPPMIHRRCGGVMVHPMGTPAPRTAEGRSYRNTEAILWVVELGDLEKPINKSKATFETPYVALGSRGEASLAYIPAQLCITFKVGPSMTPKPNLPSLPPPCLPLPSSVRVAARNSGLESWESWIYS